MGTSRTDYLMLGIDVGYDSIDYDRFEAEIDGGPDARFDIVYDGMCGQYAVAGKIIAKSDPAEGLAMTTIDSERLNIDRAAVAAGLSDALQRPDITPDSLSLILFSHFH